MTKFGLQQAEPEVYGLLTDMTEQLMKDLIVKLINQSRVRRQDADPKMQQQKPGDRAKVKTWQYFDEATENGPVQIGLNGKAYK